MGDLGHASLDQLWKSAKIIARASITPDIVKAVQAAREPGCVFAGSRLIIMAVYRGADDVMEIVLMYMYVHILQLLNADTLTEHRTDQQNLYTQDTANSYRKKQLIIILKLK